MPRNPDPGGVFDSNTHRRVLGHVDHHPREHKTRDTVAALAFHLADDAGRDEDLDESGVEEILRDLEANGYVKDKDGQWSRTASGTKALNANIPEETDA